MEQAIRYQYCLQVVVQLMLSKLNYGHSFDVKFWLILSRIYWVDIIRPTTVTVSVNGVLELWSGRVLHT